MSSRKLQNQDAQIKKQKGNQKNRQTIQEYVKQFVFRLNYLEPVFYATKIHRKKHLPNRFFPPLSPVGLQEQDLIQRNRVPLDHLRERFLKGNRGQNDLTLRMLFRRLQEAHDVRSREGRQNKNGIAEGQGLKRSLEELVDGA